MTFPTSETDSHEGPQCPHCGRQYTADDPAFFDERNYVEETCDDCGKQFAVRVETTVTWTCWPKMTEAELLEGIESLTTPEPQ